MKLRKAFFAPAPKAQSFSYVVQNSRGNGAPVSRSEQGENARPLVILGQRPLAGSRPREQGASAEHEPLARHFQIGSKPVRATPLDKSRFQIIKFNHQTLRETESKIWREIN
jgi:hypothetical protein